MLRWLERHAVRRNREGLTRFGITSAKAFGVSMATMGPLARRLGCDHALAEALWTSGWHEARILAGLAGEPAALTAAGMDRWAREFDNWAVTDSTCLHLFSKSPLPWGRVRVWSPPTRAPARRDKGGACRAYWERTCRSSPRQISSPSRCSSCSKAS